MKTRNILVPIDFGKESKAGLATAIDIASQINAKIHLLHIIDDSGPSDFQPDADMIAKEANENRHERFMVELIGKKNQQLQSLIINYDFGTLEVLSNIEFGKYAETIERFLSKNPIDLIVMGTTGETNIYEWFTGNHAAQTVRLAEVPVLAVKDYQSIGLQSNLLLMVELKDYSKEAIRSISQFATLLDMNVHIVYIKTHAGLISDNVSEHIKTFAENNNFKKFTTSVAEIDGDLDQINTLAKRVSADVIACVSEGDSGLIRFIFGSDTEKILNETNLPVLAVSDK